jgi:hypothetical protein
MIMKRALEEIPRDGEHVLYWFEAIGYMQGCFSIQNGDIGDGEVVKVHMFSSQYGFLANEDVYWISLEEKPENCTVNSQG